MKPVVRLLKNTAIGGLAGFAAGRVVSDAMGASTGGQVGASVGAAVGAVMGLPGARILRGLSNATRTYTRGLKATPSSKVGKVMRRIDRGKVAFRRIRGRIVPVRVKP
jgi:hypothetical protein